jgi:hypothetical protein
MEPFEIIKKSANLEVLAKITDSLVQVYGCRVKYDKDTGRVDLLGETYCEDVVEHVFNDKLLPNFVGLTP